METATRIIAIASLVNVIVLAVYACFTWGVWRQTKRGAQRTEELARQSRDALKLQVVTVALHQEQAIKARFSQIPSGPIDSEAATKDAMQAEKEICDVRQALAKVFPDLWQEIEPMLPK